MFLVNRAVKGVPSLAALAFWEGISLSVWWRKATQSLCLISHRDMRFLESHFTKETCVINR